MPRPLQGGVGTRHYGRAAPRRVSPHRHPGCRKPPLPAAGRPAGGLLCRTRPPAGAPSTSGEPTPDDDAAAPAAHARPRSPRAKKRSRAGRARRCATPSPSRSPSCRSSCASRLPGARSADGGRTGGVRRECLRSPWSARGSGARRRTRFLLQPLEQQTVGLARPAWARRTQRWHLPGETQLGQGQQHPAGRPWGDGEEFGHCGGVHHDGTGFDAITPTPRSS